MDQIPSVLFVCEHGAAKSVVAAAYFNKLAGERNLDIHALARGTDPEAELSPVAMDGLARDGLVAGEERPIRLSEGEAADAMALISFCDLPEGYDRLTHVERWADVPPVSLDYEKSRDAILKHLEHFLDKLEKER